MYKLLTAIMANVQSGDTRPDGETPPTNYEMFAGILVGITISVAVILLVLFVKTLIDYSKENKRHDDKKE